MFTRSRRRPSGARLLRGVAFTFGGLLLLGLVSRLLGGDEDRSASGTNVAFRGTVRAVGAPEKPDAASAEAPGREIHDALEALYEEGFTDPAAFVDATFPLAGQRFVGDAALGFVEDRDVLTIGPLAPRVRQVRVERAAADVTVYLEEERPVLATADVRFAAIAALEDGRTEVVVEQEATFVLEDQGDLGWVVTNYYDVAQTQRSRPIEEAPAG